MADNTTKHHTSKPAGNWSMTVIDRPGIAILFLSDLRRQGDARMAEMKRQTAILQRIDERLKRNGMSLAKRNRK